MEQLWGSNIGTKIHKLQIRAFILGKGGPNKVSQNMGPLYNFITQDLLDG